MILRASSKRTRALRAAAGSRGHDFRTYTDAQIESASALVALQTSDSDPQFFHYLASIVAEMPARHRPSLCDRRTMAAETGAVPRVSN